MLSALADLGSILFIFFIGRRLYSPRIGLLAAALSALAVLPIQQSHFYTVDSFAGFFITAAGFFVVRAAQLGRWLDFAMAGLGLGLALASKQRAGLVDGPVAGHLLLPDRQHRPLWHLVGRQDHLLLCRRPALHCRRRLLHRATRGCSRSLD
jgi:4-amino-4-deoxy-L-arabinose transferase-like glycosyltransferase